MARPALGDSGKTKIITVRVTPAEKTYLERKYGTCSNALRSLIDEQKRRSLEGER